jgi:hypothetical protein
MARLTLATEPNAPIEEEVQLLHISTHIPSRFLRGSVDGSASIRSFTPPTTTFVHRTFIFRPVNNLPWAMKVARHPLYKFSVAVILIVLAVWCFDPPYFETALPFFIPFSIVASIYLFFFELTRTDRLLLTALTRQFDFWVVFISAVGYFGFGTWAAWDYFGGGFNTVIPFTLAFFATLFVLALDGKYSFLLFFGS